MIKAVLFDVGHTLLKTVPSVGEVYAREAAILGARIEPGPLSKVFSATFAEMAGELARATVGIRASDDQEREMWRTVVHRVHSRLPELARISPEDWYLRLHEAFARPDHWVFYADAEPALLALRKSGLRLGLVSNWSTRLRSIAEGMGLAKLIDFMMISAEVGVAKPDRRIFDLALKKAEVAPHEALHVGDLVDYDVRGAQTAGIHAALLVRGGSSGDTAGAHVIGDLRELSGVVARINGQGSA